MNAEKVNEFLQLTGCSRDEANIWLEMAEFNVEQAINMYFGNGQNEAPPAPAGNSNDMDDYNPADYDFSDEDSVRKGDEVITQTLLGSPIPSSRHNIANMEHVLALQRQYQNTVNAAKPVGKIANRDSDPPLSVFGNMKGTKKEQNLASLYKPNAKLMYRGNFQQACEYAKTNNRWLLVSIHADNEFACHVLNRDVWSDELIEELVLAGFVFWCREDKSEEGREFISRYKVVGAPYLGLIDPRTGGLVKCFVGTKGVPSSAEGMAERLQDIMSSYPTPSDYKVAGAVVKTIGSVDDSSGYYGTTTSRTTAKFSVPLSTDSMAVDAEEGEEDGEDEQLQEALRLSVENSQQSTEKQTNSATAYINATDDDVEYVGKVPTVPTEGFYFSEFDLNSESSTSSDASVKIQFKLCDGKKIIKTFGLEQKLMEIPQSIAASAFNSLTHTNEKKSSIFELMYGFPQKSFSALCREHPNASVSDHLEVLRNAVMVVRNPA